MPFLRQLYKQKPQAWGPVSSVQASIFKNAERIGIVPNQIMLVMPLWEMAGIPVDYSKNKLSFAGSTGVGWQIGGVRPTNLQTNTESFFSRTVDFTILSIVDITAPLTANHGILGSCKDTNAGWGLFVDISDHFTSYANVSVYDNGYTSSGNKRATSINNAITNSKDAIIAVVRHSVNYTADMYALGTVNMGSSDTGVTQSGTGYTYIGQSSSGFTANIFPGIIKLLLVIQSALNASQIAYLSDNPYFLLHRVAPVFYSIPGSAGDVTISSTIGALVVTGYNVGIETGVTISVNTGIITGTGFNVEVEQGTSIKTTIGEISINGLNPDIVQGTQFIVTQGMVTINSFDTTVLNGTEIDVTSKNVNITGHAVEVEQGIIITSNVESIVITGYNVSVTNELIISLNVGSVIITGYNTTVLAGTKIDLTKTEITITGLNLEIEQGTQIDVISETIIVTGLDVSVENALSINVTTGSVNVIGYPVFVYAGILVEATIGNVAITGYNPTVAQSSGIEVTTGQVTITGLDTTIECTVLIEPTTGMVIIASYDVTVTDGLVAETPITRTNVVAASNRVITNSGSSRLIVIT